MKHHPLRIERERRNWSQAKLAEALGTTHKTVSRWEQGQTVPSPYYREKLCLLFEKNAYELGLIAEQETDEVHEVELQDGNFLAKKASGEYSFLLDPAVPGVLEKEQRLLGRDALFEQLKSILRTGGSLALTALQGLPGIGKTALALELTADAEIQAQYPDGILWVGLGTQPNVLAQLVRWGALLGVQPRDVADPTSAEEWCRTLRAIIGLRRMLLIIDDAWNAEDALAFQIGGKQCAHLVTTRSPQVAFAFAHERVVVVPELVQEDGVLLLARFVPQLVELDLEGARALVNAVGALPLALTVLGKYLASQALSGQPRRLRAALEKLRKAEQRLQVSVPIAVHERSPSLPAGTPLSLQAAIAVSYQQLPRECQEMLCALSVFPAKPNSFAEEAALAVSQQSEETLDMLWDTGLLESSTEHHYMLHQTVADYARTQMDMSHVQQPFVQYVVSYVREHEQDYALLEQETSNIFAAFDVAIQLGMWRELIEGVKAFEAFLRVRGLYQQAEHYFTQALHGAEVLKDQFERMLLLRSLAILIEEFGGYEQIENYCQQGLFLARQFQRVDVESDLLGTLGLAAFRRGKYAEARAYYEHGLRLARQVVGQSDRICKLLDHLGKVFRLQGDYSQAKSMYEEGLLLARRHNHQEYMSLLLSSITVFELEKGNYEQAEHYALEGLKIARQLGHRAYTARVLTNLGMCTGLRQQYQQSDIYLQEALTLMRQIGSREMMCTLLANLGTLREEQGQYEEAKHYLYEGIGLAREMKHNLEQGQLLINLGSLLKKHSEYEKADEVLRESVEVSRQAGSVLHLAAALIEWGEIHLIFSRMDEAFSTFQEVMSIIEDIKTIRHYQDIIVRAFYGLAQVAAFRHEYHEAEQLGKEGLTLAEAIGDPHAEEIRQWLTSLQEKTVR